MRMAARAPNDPETDEAAVDAVPILLVKTYRSWHFFQMGVMEIHIDANVALLSGLLSLLNRRCGIHGDESSDGLDVFDRRVQTSVSPDQPFAGGLMRQRLAGFSLGNASLHLRQEIETLNRVLDGGVGGSC